MRMARVRGVIDRRTRSKSISQSGSAERQQHGLDAQGDQCLEMVAVERFEEEHLVAGIEQRQAGGVVSRGGARGDDDLVRRVDRKSIILLYFSGDCFAQGSDAVGARIDVVAVANGALRAVDYRVGNWRIAYALCQVDAADTVALHRHCPDFRLRDVA